MPSPSLRVTLRIFGKAIIVLLILNFACVALAFDPVASITQFNTWWMVGHGRPRLVYPSDFQNGQLPMESLLGAHSLAYTPKAPDEFRVLALGESGIAGWGLADPDTFTGQLNARGVQIGGKRVVAYNLAYPSPSVARDVLILDTALAYKPDLVIWFISPAALDDSPASIDTNGVLFDLNRARLKRITDAFNLQTWFDAHLAPEPAWTKWIAIHHQDTLPVWMNTLFYPFVPPDLGLTTRRIGSEAIPATARYHTGQPGFETLPNDTWRFLNVGQQLSAQAGAKFLLINEAMLIGSGPNSDVNYNREYERAFYERYRQALSDYAAANGMAYADLWNAIPASSFTDTPLHADRAGFAALVDAVIPKLKSIGEES